MHLECHQASLSCTVEPPEGQTPQNPGQAHSRSCGSAKTAKLDAVFTLAERYTFVKKTCDAMQAIYAWKAV